ncbi:hypothetical protein CEXT_433721 [Caerostris extrusa]|uniref:Uncharacterized protein n=1 Tax=Caerostris extrusa TaxID=172846 RepID=A0AAV4TME3_CAEEX|nr:hypothetical protein CEXT_433721 [Caerostris extrusa]
MARNFFSYHQELLCEILVSAFGNYLKWLYNWPEMILPMAEKTLQIARNFSSCHQELLCGTLVSAFANVHGFHKCIHFCSGTKIFGDLRLKPNHRITIHKPKTLNHKSLCKSRAIRRRRTALSVFGRLKHREESSRSERFTVSLSLITWFKESLTATPYSQLGACVTHPRLQRAITARQQARALLQKAHEECTMVRRRVDKSRRNERTAFL